MANRPTRRREAKQAVHDMMTVPPVTADTPVDVTIEDIQFVLANNPMFRVAVVNASLQRQLNTARAALLVPPVHPADGGGVS